MRLGSLKIFIFCIILYFQNVMILFGEDSIKSVPLINLEDLSPTFEEDKDELEKIENKNANIIENSNVSNKKIIKKNNKVYVNLTALDKITAKTSSIQLPCGNFHCRDAKPQSSPPARCSPSTRAQEAVCSMRMAKRDWTQQLHHHCFRSGTRQSTTCTRSTGTSRVWSTR